MLDLPAPHAAARDGRGMTHIVSTTSGPPFASLCARQLVVARDQLTGTVPDTARCPDCVARYREATLPKPPATAKRAAPRGSRRANYSPGADPPRSLG